MTGSGSVSRDQPVGDRTQCLLDRDGQQHAIEAIRDDDPMRRIELAPPQFVGRHLPCFAHSLFPCGLQGTELLPHQVRHIFAVIEVKEIPHHVYKMKRFDLLDNNLGYEAAIVQLVL